MKILVTGGAGYVRSALVPALINEGHHITCLDRFFFGDSFLSSKEFSQHIELIKDDIRWFNPDILKNQDLVIDLAALSNDPVGDLNPEKTFEINHLGRARVAKLSKENGVPQYILASSASVYGQQEDIVNEESNVNPLTSYSQANRKAELDAISLNDDKFTTSVLRFSSIFGISPRMRFDLAVNSLVLDYFNTGKIRILGKNNKRPFLHIKDAVRAYLQTINSEKSKISGEIFNVGSDKLNYKIGALGEEVKNSLDKDCEVILEDTPDHRSYSVSFEKIRRLLDYKTIYTVKDASEEIHNALITKSLIFNEKMITVKWYNKILNDQTLLKEFSINGKFL